MINNKSDKCISCEICNERSPLFNLLSKEELTIMNAGRFEVHFEVGETIVKQGTSANHLIVLTQGMAKLFLEGIDKKHLILDLILPWKLFGGPGVFNDMRYHYSVTALSETTACFISSENVRQVIRLNPDFSEAILKHCNRNSAANFDRLISLTQKQMPGRLADTLLYLTQDIFQSQNFTLPITRHELGEMSNMTKESVTRILKEFESEGMLRLNGKSVEILKMDSLKEISVRG